MRMEAGGGCFLTGERRHCSVSRRIPLFGLGSEGGVGEICRKEGELEIGPGRLDLLVGHCGFTFSESCSIQHNATQ